MQIIHVDNELESIFVVELHLSSEPEPQGSKMHDLSLGVKSC